MKHMLRSLLLSLVFSVPFVAAAPGAPAQQNAGPQPSADSGNSAQAPAASQRATRRRPPVRRRTARVPAGSQTRPSRERFQQSQKALIEAGFDPGPADGAWGPNSENALYDFQEARGLEPTGRIDALSLIELGLGPNHETPDTPAETPTRSSGAAR